MGVRSFASGRCTYDTDKAADKASDVEQAAFLAFVGTPPQTMDDTRLQAKHILGWLDRMAADIDQPVFDWLEAVTGEAWPDYCSDEASEVEAA